MRKNPTRRAATGIEPGSRDPEPNALDQSAVVASQFIHSIYDLGHYSMIGSRRWKTRTHGVIWFDLVGPSFCCRPSDRACLGWRYSMHCLVRHPIEKTLLRTFDLKTYLRRKRGILVFPLLNFYIVQFQDLTSAFCLHMVCINTSSMSIYRFNTKYMYVYSQSKMPNQNLYIARIESTWMCIPPFHRLKTLRR